MSKYLVETFYTCTFKIIHNLDELNEKKLSELENRNDGKFEIIDVKLNNRKTKTIDEKSPDISLSKSQTKNIPDPDLLIRTGGEFRISNFLLWQIAYTEIHITDCYWPDFTNENLLKALNEYQRRERRFGKTSPQIQIDND